MLELLTFYLCLFLINQATGFLLENREHREQLERKEMGSFESTKETKMSK